MTHGETRPDAEVRAIGQMGMVGDPNFLGIVGVGVGERKKGDLGIISTYVKKLMREGRPHFYGRMGGVQVSMTKVTPILSTTHQHATSK